jgi:hypothetical protein
MDRSFSAAFLYRLFLIAAVFALFLPFLGPTLDHHAPERHPYHDHIYFSPSTTAHVHFYEDGDSHSHHHGGSNSGARTLQQDGSDDTKVVYLTASDGLGQSATCLAVTALYVEVVYPYPGDGHILMGLRDNGGLPPEAFVPPPRKPPRA